ncbi:MAG: terpene cyclase/mutase family protein [bacterium]|nr:terpene cyclase/mutase family protein [bacterium]
MSKKISVFGFIILIALFWTSVYITPARAEETVPPESPAEENIVPPEEETLDGEEEVGEETEAVNTQAFESEENIEEELEEPTPPLAVEATITLKNGCEVKDTNDLTHYFPLANSPSEYLAVCALFEAKEEGIIEDFELIEFTGVGLFVDSINGIKEPGTFWALYYNDAFEMNHGMIDLALAAEDSISLKLTSFAGEILDQSLTLHIGTLEDKYNNIILPDHCSVTDTDGIVHEFPEETSPSEFLAICALTESLEQGFISDVDFVNFSFGLFVDNFENITKPENAYWQFRLNVDSASTGVTQATLGTGDTISFVLTVFNPITSEEEAVEPIQSFAIRVIALENLPDEENEGGEGSGGGGGGSESPEFSVPDAVAYLKSMQDGDGSFAGEELYTDWATIAYVAASVSGNSKSSLLDYLESNNSISSLITDNERRAMALLALGKNPYDWHGKNYIQAIIEEFDGEQFGDSDLVNDDIFALLPLSKAGYDEDDEIISKTIAFILSEQKGNGSWESSVDVTAAAVQALVPFDSEDGVSDALLDAETYIRAEQKSNGGWENVFSTSWALQAEEALNASWSNNGKNGLDYLASAQDESENGGAVLSEAEGVDNAIWATSYAIPAGLGKTWNNVMDSVSKPKNNNDGDDDSSSGLNNDDTNENDTDTEGEVLGAETEPETTIPLTSVEFIPVAAATTINNNTMPPPTYHAAAEEVEEVEIPSEVNTENPTTPSDTDVNSELLKYFALIAGGGAGLSLLYLALKNIFGF